MVTSICPICGSMMHGLPDANSEQEWYKEHYPHLPVGSVVPAICLECFRPKSLGDFVIFRNERDNNPSVYVITDIISSPDQLDVYQLADHNVPPRYAAVSQIEHKKVEYPEANPEELSEKQEGYF